MNPEAIYKHILGLACSVFDAYSAVLFLPEEDASSYYLAASFSLGDNIPPNVTVEPGKGLVGMIIQNHKPFLAKDFDLSRVSIGYYNPDADEYIKAFMGVPIPTGGAFCIDSKRQYSFSEKDFKILQLFAELVAKLQGMGKDIATGDIPRYFTSLAIIQDLRTRYKRWPVYLKCFLKAISDATEFDYCAFATLQEDSESYCLECESAPLLLAHGQYLRIPIGHGIVGRVFLDENEIFAEEGGLSPSTGLFGKLEGIPEFPAAICLPVMINRVCRGVLCVANTEIREVNESLHIFLRQAVTHLAMFLENLYLKNRVRELLPPAQKQPSAGRVYDPDTAPMPQKTADETDQ